MSTYSMAPKEVSRIVERMMKRFHSELHDVGVTVDCLFAHSATDKYGDSTGPALKLAGYQVAGVIRIINLKDRTAGSGDSEIVLDGDRWDEWSEEEHDALVDHELTHLELVTDKDGVVKRDDLDRPKLRLRKHDHQFGWFDCVARRHGSSSFEIQQWDAFQESHRQLWIKFSDEPEPDFEKAERSKDLSAEVSEEFKKRGILATAK